MDSQSVLRALASGLAGAVLSYGVTGIKVESRVAAIEKSLERIEARLYAPAAVPAAKE